MPCPDMYGGSFVKGGNFGADIIDIIGYDAENYVCEKSMPCPDMYGGSFVKGGNFVDLKDVALAA